MVKFRLTFANGATEIVEAKNASDAMILRMYTKHTVVSIKRLGDVPMSVMDLFN